MKTTIPKLRRIVRKTLKESLNANGMDPVHLSGLKDWITQATEDGMEEDYETTVASYMEACADEGDPVTQEFVEDHLEELLNNDGEIEDYGGLIINADLYDEMEEDEDY